MSSSNTQYFFKSLGFPEYNVHNSFNHFDFSRGNRRILVIGPMGSGKTEYSARVWRDSRVALKKSDTVAQLTKSGNADRREVFFVRSMLDKGRFPQYPDDALAYRGGYERLGNNTAFIRDSFDLDKLLNERPDVGTWILDEASFYDERIAYVVKNASEERDLCFIFPTLILNFRRDLFNPTARLLLNFSTDVFPLTAYCEHEDCLVDSFYTYRYYTVNGKECPALYFDPLIIIGGDAEKEGPVEPNYCTRCDEHHYLPGKEYTYLFLKPFGELAARGDIQPLRQELEAIKADITKSKLFTHFESRFSDNGKSINMNSLTIPLIAERALMYVFSEHNLISEPQLLELAKDLELDIQYLAHTLAVNKRPVPSLLEL